MLSADPAAAAAVEDARDHGGDVDGRLLELPTREAQHFIAGVFVSDVAPVIAFERRTPGSP